MSVVRIVSDYNSVTEVFLSKNMKYKPSGLSTLIFHKISIFWFNLHSAKIKMGDFHIQNILWIYYIF